MIRGFGAAVTTQEAALIGRLPYGVRLWIDRNVYSPGGPATLQKGVFEPAYLPRITLAREVRATMRPPTAAAELELLDAADPPEEPTEAAVAPEPEPATEL